MKDVRMGNCSLASDFIITPKEMTSILIHIFPRIGGQISIDKFVCNITIEHCMNPAKDYLILQLAKIIRIANLGITDNRLRQNNIPCCYPPTCRDIILVSIAKNITIPPFKNQKRGAINSLHIFRNKCSSILILFM